MADIVTVAGVAEPLRAYNFVVHILRAPSGVSWDEGFHFRVRSVSIPEQSFDTIEIPYRWFRWFVQGREATDKSVDIVFWDGEDRAIYLNLLEWRKKIGDWLTGEQGTKQDISGDLRIALLDGKETEIGAVVLKNAFLTTLSAVDLSYEDSRVVEVRATFRFDWLEVE